MSNLRERMKDRLLTFLVGERSWEIEDRKLRFLSQRIKNIETWDESDLWDLRSSLARTIYQRLEAFCPPRSRPGNMTDEEWDKTLQKMLFGFWFYGWEETKTHKKYIKDSSLSEKELWNHAQEGIDLFAKYFSDLWD